MRNSLLALASFLFSLNAHAGWVSAGGGELFGDAHNPWFVKNVTDVDYCIDIAENSVSASATDITAAVADSIAYWQNEFAKADQGQGAGQFKLGTQKFHSVPCSRTSVQLRFQFGYETLSAEQSAFLINPLNYIGVAIRTDYDSDLRGKGFIFIASDKGPHAYHGGTDPTLITEAWRNPRLLKYALLHELGHVFGMPHTGSGIMSEPFLEQILSPALADNFVRTPIPSFFAVDDTIEICPDSLSGSSTMAFFGAPSGDTCLQLKRSDSFRWLVSSRKDRSTAGFSSLGTLILSNPQLGDFQARPAIVLQLEGNTSVFTPQETMFRSFMFGPMFIDFGIQGNFVPTSGAPKSVYAKFTPDSLVVQGVTNNKIQLVLSYASPIGILLMQKPTPIQSRGE